MCGQSGTLNRILKIMSILNRKVYRKSGLKDVKCYVYTRELAYLNATRPGVLLHFLAADFKRSVRAKPPDQVFAQHIPRPGKIILSGA